MIFKTNESIPDPTHFSSINGHLPFERRLIRNVLFLQKSIVFLDHFFSTFLQFHFSFFQTKFIFNVCLQFDINVFLRK